jgi:hypothetical protein
MADNTPSRFLSVNGGADKREQALKVFGGEVFTAWSERNVTLDRHFVRSIPSGKSAAFPMIGKADSQYHVAGTEITGDATNGAEQVIVIDDVLYSAKSVADIDEALSHFDVRKPYADAMGAALARQFDRNVLRVGIQAARASNPVVGLPGGSKLVEAAAKTSGVALAEAIVEAARVMDEKDIPEEDRFAYVLPRQYTRLFREAKDFIDLDFGNAQNGSQAEGRIGKIAGVSIIKTNNLPSTDLSADATVLAKYRVNAANTACLIMNRMAVGTVKLMNLAVDTEYSLRRLSTLMVARYAIGHGVLRPDCALEIATA